MKRWSRRLALLGLVLALGLAGFVLSGYLLPSRLALGVDATVAAPPDRVFPLLTTAEGLSRWWTAVEAPDGYPALEVRHVGGPTEGPGLQVAFGAAGSDLEFEWWTLTASEPPSQVEYDVDFGIFVVHRTLTLAPVGEGTAVAWRETAEVTNPLVRWMVTLSGSEGATENFRVALRALEAAAGQ